MIERVWLLIFGESLAAKRRSGPGQVRVVCPFHFDHAPSLDVHLTKNVFCCRSCGASGGYLDVPTKAGITRDRREAAEWLKSRGMVLR